MITLKRRAAGIANVVIQCPDEVPSSGTRCSAPHAPTVAEANDSVALGSVTTQVAEIVSSALSASSTEDASATSAAADLGRYCARSGVSLVSVMRALWAGFGQRWQLGSPNGSSPPDAASYTKLREGVSKMLGAQESVCQALHQAYRDEQKQVLLNERSRRDQLFDGVLQGQVFGQWSMWDIADALRLPGTGEFVVAAADLSASGGDPLPGIEPKLRSIDVRSAWCLLPDVQVGIVHLHSDTALAALEELLARLATGRVGISARYNDLRGTAQAFRFARAVLRSSPDSDSPVSTFDGSVLATAAVSAPDVVVQVAADTIGQFGALTRDERDILFDTFRVWVKCLGSFRDTGAALYCHPNTVRYRLGRIEQRTGRSLSNPRDVAELCLVFEIYHRLMWHNDFQ